MESILQAIADHAADILLSVEEIGYHVQDGDHHSNTTTDAADEVQERAVAILAVCERIKKENATPLPHSPQSVLEVAGDSLQKLRALAVELATKI